MEEHPILAILIKLLGDFTDLQAPFTEASERVIEACARALMQGQSPDSMRDTFAFERITHFNSQYVSPETRERLNGLLGQWQATPQDTEHRVFLREMPENVSWLRSSMPSWALSAALTDTIGPLRQRDGRYFWLDLYRIPERRLEARYPNAPQSALWFAPDTSLTVRLQRVNTVFRALSTIETGPGTIWIQARLFSADASADRYCGIKLTSATLTYPGFPSPELGDFNDQELEDLVLLEMGERRQGVFVLPTLPGAPRAVLTIHLAPQDVPAGADDYGSDARAANVQLPESLSISFDANGGILTAVNGSASWNLYGDAKTMTWNNAPATYDGVFEAVAIPMTPDNGQLSILQRQSPILSTAGSAPISEAAWLLPAARLSHVLQAEGAGMLWAKTGVGLEATCVGLLDTNGEQAAQLRLEETFLTASPTAIQILSWKTTTEHARQRYEVWTSTENRRNDLQLDLKKSFPVVYCCQASGRESFVVVAHLSARLDRPVGADGQPIGLQSNYALSFRTFSAQADYLVIYNDNMLREAASPTFQSKALVLNNALMAISPPSALLLSGRLAPFATAFAEAGLQIAYGLLGYIPTLPDPYAANLGILKDQREIFDAEDRHFEAHQIQRLLIGSLTWADAEAPSLRFMFGDLESMVANIPLPLDPMRNLTLAREKERASREEMSRKNTQRGLLRTGVETQRDDFYDVHLWVNDSFQHSRFFSLLDVSTAADWMGVDLGLMDDRFFFERSFEVKTDKNPLSTNGMDVVATGRFVRLFTPPQISWEPVTNLRPPFDAQKDPPEGLLTFQNDGPPALIGNTGNEPVPIAPLPLARYLVSNYAAHEDFKAWSFFTLPFGLTGIARYNQNVPEMGAPDGARIGLVQRQFAGNVESALQISTVGYLNPDQNNRNFEGITLQLDNLHDAQGRHLGVRNILTKTVSDIFNNEFGPNIGRLKPRGVPVERYDFSGYGANIFSRWLNDKAEIGQTSQAKFDVWRGRTAYEVIQVRSIIYPCCAHVVRTITMYRNSAGLVYRVDSGWVAESDGLYNFQALININGAPRKVAAYEFHPGVVKGFYNLQNIVETSEIAPFIKKWRKTDGFYVNPATGKTESVGAGQDLDVWLTPVYYDADVAIEGAVSGAVNGRVPGKRMLGFLQKSPAGIVLSPEDFAELLMTHNGLGGPLDCLVDIGESGQTQRVSRVEVQPSRNAANKLVFAVAAQGSPVLPKDGSWSVVRYLKTSDEVLPVQAGSVPLVRRGVLGSPPAGPLELSNPADLFNPVVENRALQYGFLQSTDTQKVLFRNPSFEQGLSKLRSSAPDLADAYRLLDSKGIFPKLDGLPQLDPNNFDIDIKKEGYKLLNKVDPGKMLDQVIPKGPIYFVNEKEVKIYVEYEPKDKDGKGAFQYDLDSEARRWAGKLSDVTMVVDLLDMKRLFLIKGKMDTEKGAVPAFVKPELSFGPALKPVYDILQILASLNTGSYADVLKKGLKVAMSNSPSSWQYKFQADKEIPVLKFPPPLADNPAAPLRLECFLKLGCYCNVGLPSAPGESFPTPSGGAFIEFGAKLSVMCLSVAAATVYAVGTCTLRISADTVKGPGMALKIGFGVELMVGLPVIGNVSVYYACGIEISIDKREIVVGAFILFRGRAELIGGLVTIQIMIEAAGKIAARLEDANDPNGGKTECIAQVTFSLDISIFLVINISFSKTFQETRQIA